MTTTKQPPLDRATIRALTHIVRTDTLPASLRDRAAIFLIKYFTRQRDERLKRDL
jgi:hypothetical protein